MLKFLLILFTFLFIMVYFIPSFIAIARKHVHVLQITILNAFLGWSFLGWVAALIWATMCKSDENAQIKASWIIIALCLFFSELPIFVISLIPYKANSIIETQYKNVVISSPKGIVKQETKEIHEKKD